VDAVRYTDVDRLILDRWSEVVALREAFDGVLDRMRGTVEAGIVKAERWASERGYRTESDIKTPTLDVWRPDWENKRREPALWVRVGDFAPHEYGSVEQDHPWVWWFTEDLSKLKLSEVDRIAFARQLRGELGSTLSRWDHHECNESDTPLGRYCSDVSDAQRVKWMTSPEDLAAFLVAAVEDAMTLAPAVDTTLARFRKG
jgi:hypothetical protein